MHKIIISHPQLYIVKFSKEKCNENILFIHGGPGFNCGVLEHLIENDSLFESLDYNIILYDQRGCGKSAKQNIPVSHQNNIDDLNELLIYLLQHKILIKGLIGHSYGAKLLFDFYQRINTNIPAVFVGVSDSMLTPRLNNLLADLNYLKKIDPDKYTEILPKLGTDLTLQTLWQLTEELTPIFQANQDRPFLAWANLQYLKKAQDIQKIINLPVNQDILMSVRRNIYLNEEDCEVDITNLHVPYLWVNGFHDYAMNGSSDFFRNKKVTLFYQSAHYPHIEENLRFCALLNKFLTPA